MRTLRVLDTSTLSVVSAFTLCISSGCLPLTDHAPESSLRLSPRIPAPRMLYLVSPRQLLQSETGVPHFALDPLTYRCLLSLSPAADFAEPRPPRHNHHLTHIHTADQKACRTSSGWLLQVHPTHNISVL